MVMLADVNLGDWFGGILFSAGQQANEAVQNQLTALSFTRCVDYVWVFVQWEKRIWMFPSSPKRSFSCHLYLQCSRDFWCWTCD